MVRPEKVTQLQWDADRVRDLLPSVEASPWGGLDGVAAVLGNAHLWELTAGNARMLMAVRGVVCEQGRRLDVVGFRSMGERLAAADVAPLVDHVAALENADLLAMCTRHEHLVRACVRNGWTRTGSVVIKPLRLQ